MNPRELTGPGASDASLHRPSVEADGPLVRPGDDAFLPLPDLEDRYRLLVEHSPDIICVHQLGVIVYVNSAGLRYLRAQTREHVVGRPITDFVAPDSIGPMLERIAALDAHEMASAPAEATIRALDGTTVEMQSVSVRTVWNGEPAFQVILRDLTEHNAAQAALRYQAALVTHVSDAIIGVSSAGLVSSWNPAAESMYGRNAAEVLGRSLSFAVGVPCEPAVVLAAGGRFRDTHRNASCTPLAVLVSAAQMRDGYVLVCADQSAVRRAEEHFTAVVESLEEGVVVLDHTGRVTSANLAAKTILDIQTGLQTVGRAEFLPFRVYDTDSEPVTPFADPVATTQRTGEPTARIVGVERLRDGHQFWLSLTATMLTPDDPASSIVATFFDITEPYRTRVELEHAATHDHLTGLPNRLLLHSRLNEELAPRHRQPLTVLFIDLDDFKAINDAHGHAIGDTVLRTVADRLAPSLPHDAHVGRIGGDEFVAVICGRVSDEIATVQDELAQPIMVDGSTLIVTATIGKVVVDRHDTRNAAEILNDADLSMYQSKPAPVSTSRHRL